MKLKYKILLSITALGVGIATVQSCKDSKLSLAPTGALGPSTLATKAGVEGSLIGTYAVLNGAGGFYTGMENWLFGGVLGGDANKGSNAGDQADAAPISRYEALPTNSYLPGTWQKGFEGVSRANRTLNLATLATDLSETDKKEVIAECKFLRGFFHFNLKQNWGNIPYIDETKDYGTGAEKIVNTINTWPLIEADIKAAMDNLPETQAEVGRVNKWAAASMLAKVYMFQNKYTEAKALFDQIIANGKTSNGMKYALQDSYPSLFDAKNDNNSETIFAVQAAANSGSVDNANPAMVLNFPYNGGPAGCCGFNQPSFDMAAAFRTDANGLPLLDGSYRLAANDLKTDMGLLSSAAFTPDAGNVDPRLDFSIGRRGIPYLDWGPHPGNDWIRDNTYGGPYAPKKFIFPKAQQGTTTDGSSWTSGYTSMNYCIIRYADLLLMAAEAEIEVGSLAKAQEYTNMVRNRAAKSAYFVKNGTANAANYKIGSYTAAWTDKAAARTAVRFERRLELSGEGKRFYDLVRWGVADTELNAYLAYESKKLPSTFGGAKFTKGKSEYLPIPQSQIDVQGKAILTQNPGY